ncbi:MAG: GAF domain-containing protein [Deltaproteobacteria bacterium]|nr:GAF domain-containing protein [Deltaproteobacteria bacterium]
MDRREDEAEGEASRELLLQIRSSMARAHRLTRQLEEQLAAHRGGAPGADDETELRLAELEGRLAEADEDREQLTMRLVELENQAGRLMSLYVATYQLHATLEPREVHTAIAEVATNLLGAESFVLLLADEAAGNCTVVLRQGDDPSGHFSGPTYEGGNPLVDATLEDGVLRLAPDGDVGLVAAVPLSVDGVTVGVLAVLSLLSHKGALADQDRDLLDLLAAHAASALFAAEVYASTQRKLRTLEGLTGLLRKH